MPVVEGFSCLLFDTGAPPLDPPSDVSTMSCVPESGCSFWGGLGAGAWEAARPFGRLHRRAVQCDGDERGAWRLRLLLTRRRRRRRRRRQQQRQVTSVASGAGDGAGDVTGARAHGVSAVRCAGAAQPLHAEQQCHAAHDRRRGAAACRAAWGRVPGVRPPSPNTHTHTCVLPDRDVRCRSPSGRGTRASG